MKKPEFQYRRQDTRSIPASDSQSIIKFQTTWQIINKAYKIRFGTMIVVQFYINFVSFLIAGQNQKIK